MHPKLWRLLVSVSLRLFLGLTAPAETHVAVLWLVAIFVAFAVPPPPARRSVAEARRRNPWQKSI